jgi:hypothetical protein
MLGASEDIKELVAGYIAYQKLRRMKIQRITIMHLKSLP